MHLSGDEINKKNIYLFKKEKEKCRKGSLDWQKPWFGGASKGWDWDMKVVKPLVSKKNRGISVKPRGWGRTPQSLSLFIHIYYTLLLFLLQCCSLQPAHTSEFKTTKTTTMEAIQAWVSQHKLTSIGNSSIPSLALF